MNCFLCRAWFRIGHIVSWFDRFENMPDWLVFSTWMPVYQYAMRRSFDLDNENDCGLWVEEGNE